MRDQQDIKSRKEGRSYSEIPNYNVTPELGLNSIPEHQSVRIKKKSNNNLSKSNEDSDFDVLKRDDKGERQTDVNTQSEIYKA